MIELKILDKPELRTLAEEPEPVGRIAVWDIMGPMGNYKGEEGTIDWGADGQPWENLHRLFLKDYRLREILNKRFGYGFTGEEDVPLVNLDFNDELLAESLGLLEGILSEDQAYFANPGMPQVAAYFDEKGITNTIVTSLHPVGMEIAHGQITEDAEQFGGTPVFPYGVGVCGLDKKDFQTWYDARKAIEVANQGEVEVAAAFEDSVENLYAALAGLSKEQEAATGFHVLSPHIEDYKEEEIQIKGRVYQVVHGNMQTLYRYVSDHIG